MGRNQYSYPPEYRARMMELVQRLGRCFTDRFHRTAQIGQGITDGNQLAALTLHGSFSHVPQTRQGHHFQANGL